MKQPGLPRTVLSFNWQGDTALNVSLDPVFLAFVCNFSKYQIYSSPSNVASSESVFTCVLQSSGNRNEPILVIFLVISSEFDAVIYLKGHT